MVKYKEWDVVDEMPEGWIVMPATPTPVHWGIPICNGKSVLSGLQKRALLKVQVKQDINILKKEIPKVNHSLEANKKIEKTEIPIFPAKTVNDLARLKFKEQLLKEIIFDLMVCELENWDKKEYINELKKMLNGIDTSTKKKGNVKSLPDLFSSVGL